jgi:hypothetical protein
LIRSLRSVEATRKTYNPCADYVAILTVDAVSFLYTDPHRWTVCLLYINTFFTAGTASMSSSSNPTVCVHAQDLHL